MVRKKARERFCADRERVTRFGMAATAAIGGEDAWRKAPRGSSSIFKRAPRSLSATWRSRTTLDAP